MVTAKRRHPLGRVLVTDSQMLTWIAAQRPLMGVERTWRGLCPLMTQSRHPRARHGGHTRLPLTVTGYYGLVIDRWTPIHLSLTDRVGPSAILTAGTIMFWLYSGSIGGISTWKRFYRLSFRLLLASSAVKLSVRSCSRWR